VCDAVEGGDLSSQIAVYASIFPAPLRHDLTHSASRPQPQSQMAEAVAASRMRRGVTPR
jgi:hypothetical protein